MKSDDIAITVLNNLGFGVEVIPTSDAEQKKEADFLVKYKNHVAIVEAKLKEDDAVVLEQREKRLQAGKVSIVDSSLGRNETYSSLIKNAKTQLESSSDKKHDFKIAFFIITGINPVAKRDQLKDTIYGSTLILEAGNKPSKRCFFYRNSDFYRRKGIDAMIIGTSYDFYEDTDLVEIELCLNPYGVNYHKLKESAFLEPFGSSITDPMELERNGLAYIPDAEIHRNLSALEGLCQMNNPILSHLQEKYDTDYIFQIDFDSPELAIRTSC